MKHIECCHHCKAPKRHPLCHATCPEYIEERKQLDEYKEVLRQRLTEERILFRKESQR